MAATSSTSSTPSRDAPKPAAPRPAGVDIQRRRRELALTARWLRELGGAQGARPAARFARPTEH